MGDSSINLVIVSHLPARKTLSRPGGQRIFLGETAPRRILHELNRDLLVLRGSHDSVQIYLSAEMRCSMQNSSSISRGIFEDRRPSEAILGILLPGWGAYFPGKVRRTIANCLTAQATPKAGTPGDWNTGTSEPGNHWRSKARGAKGGGRGTSPRSGGLDEEAGTAGTDRTPARSDKDGQGDIYVAEDPHKKQTPEGPCAACE